MPLTGKLLNYIKKIYQNIIKIEIKYSKSLLNNGSHFIALMLKIFGKLSLLKTNSRLDNSNFVLEKNKIFSFLNVQTINITL